MTTAINEKVIVAKGPVDYGGCSLTIHSFGNGHDPIHSLPYLDVALRVIDTNPSVIYRIRLAAGYILDDLPAGIQDQVSSRFDGGKHKRRVFPDSLVLRVDFDELYPELERSGALKIFEDAVKGTKGLVGVDVSPLSDDLRRSS